MITSIMLFAIVKHINSLFPKYIKKIRYFINDSFFITIHCAEYDLHLFISPSENLLFPLHYIISARTLPPRYYNIKRVLAGAKISKIYQPNLERILIFDLIARNGKKYKFIIELFQKGNIILSDEDWSIIFVSNPIKVRDRILQVGKKYAFPPRRGLSIDEILSNRQVISQKISSIKDFYRVLPFDKYTISYLLNKAGIREHFSEKELNKLISSISELLTEVSKSTQYYIVNIEGSLLLFPYNPEIYQVVECSNDLLQLSTGLFMKYIMRKYREEIDNKINKLKEKIETLLNNKKEMEQKIKSLENVIPKLYQRSHVINNIFMALKEDNYEPYKNFISKISKKEKVLWLKVNDEVVPLKYDVSFHEAIGLLYNKIKKLKVGINKLEKKINKLNEKIDIIKKGELWSPIKIWLLMRRKKWFERFRWFFTSNKLLVIAGKDATTNDIIIKKYTDKNDIILHADIDGSPFTVIKEGIKSAHKSDLIEAAIFTGAYSNAWRRGFSSIDIYWVKKEQVTKEAPSGEYLKKGAFMIYGKRNFIRGIRLELYIGIYNLDDYPIIYIAPKSSVQANCNIIIGKLIPGNIERSKLAHIILEKFKKHLKITISKQDEEYLYYDILEKLPPGKSQFIINH